MIKIKGIINKIKIPYYKTDQEPPYHKGIEPVHCTEKIEIWKIQNLSW